MGTWGSGIYDNDGALDGIASLVRLDLDDPDPTRIVASLGLVAWLQPVTLTVDREQVDEAAKKIADHRDALPPETRAALDQLLADPEKVCADSSRSAAVSSAIGGYSSGPRIDALLRFPGAETVIAELAERAAGRLDDALGGDEDLYEVAADLGALGVLVELSEAGLWRPGRERLAAWRAGLEAADQVTDEERGFWDRYIGRVRAGLDLLAAR
jgi:hypothetical protein